MSANRNSKSLAVLLVFAVVLLSVSFVARPANAITMDSFSKKEAGYSNVVSNTYRPLPPGKQTQLYNAAGVCRCPACSAGVDQIASSAHVAAPNVAVHYGDPR